MALNPVQGIAYDPTTDQVVENAAGGVLYTDVAGSTTIPAYGAAGEPLTEVTSNGDGVVTFYLQDRVEAYLAFPGMPRIHVVSSAAISQVGQAVAAASAAQTAAAEAQQAAEAAETPTGAQAKVDAALATALTVAGGTGRTVYFVNPAAGESLPTTGVVDGSIAIVG